MFRNSLDCDPEARANLASLTNGGRERRAAADEPRKW